jgi:hypothetical protein
MLRHCSICRKKGHISTNVSIRPRFIYIPIESPEQSQFNYNSDSDSDWEDSMEDSDDSDSDWEEDLIQEKKTEKVEKVEKVEKTDTYTKQVLQEQFQLHKTYVIGRMKSSKKLNISIRFPCIPEDISENIIKFAIHKNGDKTSSWNCKYGDLFSKKEKKQECKCFTSNGPLSFTPSSEWNVIYFLDARKWLTNSFVLYRVNLSKSSHEWKQIKINKTQTFQDQAKQGRRPRIAWELLYPQIKKHCKIIFKGSFEKLFLIRT